MKFEGYYELLSLDELLIDRNRGYMKNVRWEILQRGTDCRNVFVVVAC